MPYANINGYQLHYRTSGPEDGPPVVLIHGLMSCLKVWRFVMEDARLAGYRFIAVDLLGHGESQKVPGMDLSIRHQGRLVLGLMDRLGIDRAALVGHSMGGQIALWLASRHPQRVSKLVPVTAVTDARLTRRSALYMWLMRFGVAAPRLGAWLAGLFRSPRNPLRRWVVEPLYFAGRVPEEIMLEVYDELVRPDNNAAKVPAYKAIRRYRALDDAAKITAPTLIVGVDADNTVPAGQSAALNDALAGAELLIIPGCGHMVPYEAPDALNGALARFLNGHAPGGYPSGGHAPGGHAPGGHAPGGYAADSLNGKTPSAVASSSTQRS